MKKLFVLFTLITTIHTTFYAQGVTIGEDNSPPDPSAILDLQSNQKGLLIPRIDTSSVSSPATGLLIFQPSDNQFYAFKNGKWIALGSDSFSPIFLKENNLIYNNTPQTNVDFIIGRSSLPDTSQLNERFFFYDKGKSSLRGGVLSNSDAWSNDNLGSASLAWGFNNIAKGTRSYALGLLDTVYGNAGSGALGVGNLTESNNGSLTIGRENKIEAGADNGAMAFGYDNYIGPDAINGALAMGYANVNNGSDGSVVMGFQNASISDTGSVTMGRNLINNFQNAIILGKYNAYGYYDIEPIFAIGKGDSPYDFNNPRHDALSILTNGNVGINNNFPETMLEVGNSGSKPRQGIKILGNPSNKHVHLILNNNGIGGQSYSLVSSGDNATMGNGKFAIRNIIKDEELFIIDSLGRVGINNNSPEWNLDLNSSGAFLQGMRINGDTDGANVALQLENNMAQGRPYAMLSGGGSLGNLQGKYAIKDQKADAVRLVIDSTGNMGIGSLNPAQRLAVNGAIRIGSTVVDQFGSIQYNNGTFLGYNGTEWVRLDNTATATLADNDDDTRVSVEASNDIDNIQFILDDEPVFRIENSSSAYARMNPQNAKDNLVIGSGKAEVDRDSANIFIGKNVALSHAGSTKNIYIGNSVARNYSNQVEDQIAIGTAALKDASSSSSDGAIAIGTRALSNMTNGAKDIAIGHEAGALAPSGGLFIGQRAGEKNDGNANVYIGHLSGLNKTTGSSNTFVGNSVGYYASTGWHNTIMGASAGFNLTTGVRNTFVGYMAGLNVEGGQNHTIIGNEADLDTSHFSCTLLGAYALGTATHQARIGNTFTTSIGGYTGWSNLSDGRFKKNVQENVPGIEFIQALRPVTYQLDIDELHQFLDITSEGRARYEASKEDKEGIIQSGFIAQEVEEVAHSLGYDFSGVDQPKNTGDHYSLRYAEFVVPMVKAMQEQQDMIDELLKTQEELLKRIKALEEK